MCVLWPGAAANWICGARHAQLLRTDEDRLNVGIHRVCSDPNTHPEMAKCSKRSRILSGSKAAVAAGRERTVNSRFVPLSRRTREMGSRMHNDRFQGPCRLWGTPLRNFILNDSQARAGAIDPSKPVDFEAQSGHRSAAGSRYSRPRVSLCRRCHCKSTDMSAPTSASRYANESQGRGSLISR